MGISPRYTPVTGRLHTRYAPVRRSPPGYCYPALPLDLHVLSLPLAFILSQDQTLHCKNCFFLPLTRSCPTRRPRRLGVRHTLSLDPRIQCPFASLGNCCCFLESGCKDTTFFQTAKIFFRKNPTWRRKHAAVQWIAARKKICMNGKNDRKRPKKQRKKAHFSQKSGVGRATKIQYSCIILIFNQ